MAASNTSLDAQRNPTASLYVGDLHPDVTEAMLFDKFTSAGPILSVQVCRDMITRRSLGYAYVNFLLPDDAECALDTMNSDVLHGRPLRITRSQHSSALHEKELASVFIENSEIMTDENGQSQGSGFVQLETQEAADDAIEKGDGMLSADKKISVTRFPGKSEQVTKINREKDAPTQQGRNLYVRNLDDTIDDERLKREFSKFGTVTSARVIYENGQSRGFGFVCFSVPDEATKAMTEMNGSIVGSRLLYVALAQTKEKRRMHLTNQNIQRIATPQADVQSQKATGYYCTARNIQPNNLGEFSRSIVVPGQEPLTPADFANANPQEQKQMLGDRLFPLIQQMQPDLAGKITGMLLELDNIELLHMLESRESLKAKVEEAIAVLYAHQAKQRYAAKQTATNAASHPKNFKNNPQTHK